ncbi:MAG TPA: flagellar biosynthesis anti-sigma factor FlgM [Terracidiphilus sp.]|nr:flagellar biosynthesis anti-sigma factor FlgM [Terracidiphilus sp.]
MEIHNSVEGLKTLLGVPSTDSTSPQPVRSGTSASGAAPGLTGDHATLSAAATEVSISASSPDVRMDKVSAVQAALAAGTYDVPASAVATKVVDAMLAGGSGN